MKNVSEHMKADKDLTNLPRSVAIIMDGNGRWARQRNLPRTSGHVAGGKVVRKIIIESARLGLDALSLYSFSIENWNRPKDEIEMLMHLYTEYIVSERQTLIDRNIRMHHLGRREGLPQSVLRELDESIRISSKHTGMNLCLAINYGSRAEITDAITRIAERAARGKLDPAEIDENTISSELDTASVADPDLLIRTSGEMRLSNFLLWQLSYAEFYVTDVYWPDFNNEEYHKALLSYAGRHRRFGGVDKSNK